MFQLDSIFDSLSDNGNSLNRKSDKNSSVSNFYLPGSEHCRHTFHWKTTTTLTCSCRFFRQEWYCMRNSLYFSCAIPAHSGMNYISCLSKNSPFAIVFARGGIMVWYRKANDSQNETNLIKYWYKFSSAEFHKVQIKGICCCSPWHFPSSANYSLTHWVSGYANTKEINVVQKFFLYKVTRLLIALAVSTRIEFKRWGEFAV